MLKSIVRSCLILMFAGLLVLIPASTTIAQEIITPTFSINSAVLDVNETDIIAGELIFSELGADAVSFSIHHDPSYIHIQNIEIVGFHAFSNADNQNGVFYVQAVKDKDFTFGEIPITTFEILVTSQLVTDPTIPTELSIRDPQIVLVNNDTVPSTIAVSNTPIIIQDIDDDGCVGEDAQTYRVVLNSINVRNAPGNTASIIRTAYLGETFNVISSHTIDFSGVWYRVDLSREGHQQAWVYSGNLIQVCLDQPAIPPEASVPPIPTISATTNPSRPTPQPTPGGGSTTNPPPGDNIQPSNPTSAPPVNTPVPPTPAPLQPTNTSVPPTISTSDSDGDGVSDSADRCPFAPPRPWQGGGDCPDTDADGVDDAGDACPTQFGTLNGCLDSDNDGVGDEADRCRYAAGDPNNGGCPPGQ